MPSGEDEALCRSGGVESAGPFAWRVGATSPVVGCLCRDFSADAAYAYFHTLCSLAKTTTLGWRPRRRSKRSHVSMAAWTNRAGS
jgi:hypothetical protein